jgi:hypothetical protein
VLFQQSPHVEPTGADIAPFGRSRIAQRSFALYEAAVGALAPSHPRMPDPHFAAASLIAITHGIVGFTMSTSTLGWPDPHEMVAAALDGQLSQWRGPPEGGCEASLAAGPAVRV